MLINLESFGRLGNRLFLGAHLVAFGTKYGLPILNLGFGDYASEFSWLKDNEAFAYPWRSTGGRAEAESLRKRYSTREHWPWTRRFTWWGDRDLDFDREELPRLLRPLRTDKDVIFRAWLFRGFESIRTHRSEILEIFKPLQETAASIEDWIGESRKNAEVLIGLHVRWEDYRGTPQFVDQEAFRRAMELSSKLLEGKKVRFLVFSNESVDLSAWAGLDVLRSPGNSPVFDLYAMSRCDFLMGPPSTFSGWASFYGEVPLLVLNPQNLQFSREDFQVVQG